MDVVPPAIAPEADPDFPPTPAAAAFLADMGLPDPPSLPPGDPVLFLLVEAFFAMDLVLMLLLLFLPIGQLSVLPTRLSRMCVLVEDVVIFLLGLDRCCLPDEPPPPPATESSSPENSIGWWLCSWIRVCGFGADSVVLDFLTGLTLVPNLEKKSNFLETLQPSLMSWEESRLVLFFSSL